MLRLFVDAALREGASVSLDGDQATWLGRVMRRRVGERLALFNGRDGEWEAEDRGAGARLRAGVCAAAASSPGRVPGHLACLRAGEARHGGPRRAPGGGAWRRAHSACHHGAQRGGPAQSRTPRAASLSRRRSSAGGSMCRKSRRSRPCGTCWRNGRRSGRSRPAIRAAAAMQAGPPPGGLLLGPEGGFAAAELDALAETGFVRLVDLGPRILRAETAVVAALSMRQAIWGDGA